MGQRTKKHGNQLISPRGAVNTGPRITLATQYGGAATTSSASVSTPTVPPYHNNYFTANLLREQYSRKLRTWVRDYKIQFSSAFNMESLPDAFNAIIEFISAGNPQRQIRLVLTSPSLSYPISLPFMSVENMSVQSILDRIQNVVNSNETFILDDGITLNVITVAATPSFAGKRCNLKLRKQIIPLKHWIKKRKSVITIKVIDNNCLIAALEVAKQLHYSNNISDKNKKRKLRGLLVKLPHQNALVCTARDRLRLAVRDSQQPLPINGPFTVQDLDVIKDCYSEFEINVIDAEQMGEFVCRKNQRETIPMEVEVEDRNCITTSAEVPRLNLLYYDGHVDVITSMKGLFDAAHYCFACQKPCKSVYHLCKASSCTLCRLPSCANRLLRGIDGEIHNCDSCATIIKTDACRVSHRSVCDQFYKCTTCGIAVRRGRPHKCFNTKCVTCGEMFITTTTNTHLCYMKKPCDKSKKLSTQENPTQPEEEEVDEAQLLSLVEENVSSNNGPNNVEFDEDPDEEEEEEEDLSFVDDSELNVEETNAVMTEFAELITNQEESRRVAAHDAVVVGADATTSEHHSSGNKGKTVFHAFDVETDQSSGIHKPVLLMCSVIGVYKCQEDHNRDNSVEDDDNTENENELETFFGYDCMELFCNSLFRDERYKKRETFIAHFGSGFDFLPILQWCYSTGKFTPSVIMRGNRIITMTIGNKKFLDSYLFISLPLAAFPKCFGISELRKGYFPHHLTSPEALHTLSEPGKNVTKTYLLNLKRYINCFIYATNI